MNRKKIIGTLAVSALVVLMAIQLKGNKQITDEKVYHYDKANAIHVTTLLVKSKTRRNTRAFTGSFAPNRETKISAETQGKVKSVKVDVGDFVRKGQALVELDIALLQLQLQLADVAVEGLESDVSRYTVLADADAIQGVKREKAELGLKTAKINRSTLLEKINKSTVKAPFDGVITAKMTEEGGYAGPGVPLLQLTDITTLKFTVNVSERDLSTFELEQHQSITPDAHPNLHLEGTTTLIGSKADMGNSFPVQFTVNNTPQRTLKAGMFGRLNFQSARSETAILVPSSAVRENEGKTQLYVSDNGKAVLRDVELGQRVGDSVVITKGLNDGDVLITRGFTNLFDGANVVSKDRDNLK